ncbi:MAG: hypothetical protein J7L77_04355, partial [Clostridiales bacterium]|nr:hypothetical protein [Clostridiales bacterium]
MPVIKKDNSIVVDVVPLSEIKKQETGEPEEDRVVETVDASKILNLYSPEKEGQTFLSAMPESSKKDKTVFEINPQDALQAVVDADILTKNDKEGKGITPYEAYHYRDMIDKHMKINPIMASKRSTLLQRVQQAYNEGQQTVTAGNIGYQYLVTGDPKYLKELDKTQPLTEDQRFIPESAPERWALETARLLPPMVAGGKESLSYGMLGGMTAGTGAVALGFPEAAPEATLAGFRAGALTGVLKSSFQLEAGNLLNEMYHYKGKDGKGINLNVARATASMYGVVASVLETTQMTTLIKTIPGLGEVLTGSIVKAISNKTLKNKLLNIALNYSKELASETGTEVMQEAASIIFSEIGKAVSNSKFGTMIDHSTWQQKWNRLAQTAIQSLKGFSLMLLPGNVMEGGLEVATGKEGAATAGSIQNQTTEEIPGQTVNKTPISGEKNVNIEDAIHKHFEKLINLND